MRKRKGLTEIILIVFLLTVFNPLISSAKASNRNEFPDEPYKVGLNEEQTYELIFNKGAFDWRRNPQGDREFSWETPKASFSIIVNGKEIKANDATNLNLLPTYVEVKSTDDIKFKNTSTVYTGDYPYKRYKIDPQYVIYPER